MPDFVDPDPRFTGGDGEDAVRMTPGQRVAYVVGFVLTLAFCAVLAAGAVYLAAQLIVGIVRLASVILGTLTA